MLWTPCNASWHQGPWICEHKGKGYVFFYKQFDRKSICDTEYFFLVTFDEINLSTASTKSVLNLTHMSLKWDCGLPKDMCP